MWGIFLACREGIFLWFSWEVNCCQASWRKNKKSPLSLMIMWLILVPLVNGDFSGKIMCSHPLLLHNNDNDEFVKYRWFILLLFIYRLKGKFWKKICTSHDSFKNRPLPSKSSQQQSRLCGCWLCTAHWQQKKCHSKSHHPVASWDHAYEEWKFPIYICAL